jgi:pyridoxine 4-dehydrogenase
MRRYLERYPEDADRIVLTIKGGLGPNYVPLGTKENIRRSIDDCLETLGPVGRIASFEIGRKDPNVDYEQDTLAAINDYVKDGKIDGISCSELNANTLRSAAKKFKITALEIELSLFTTDPLTNGLLEVCGELDIPVLAYCNYSTPISWEVAPSLTQNSSTPRTRFPWRSDQVCRGSSRE